MLINLIGGADLCLKTFLESGSD